MDYVHKYQELYPKDEVIVIGGAAAALHAKKSGFELWVKDIDIDINTKENGKIILDRWIELLPSTYIAKYDPNFPVELFTLIDISGENMSFDIMVNCSSVRATEYINEFKVESLKEMIWKLYEDLPLRKIDVELLLSGVIVWKKKDVNQEVEKYNRLLNRAKVLVDCFKIRTNS